MQRIAIAVLVARIALAGNAHADPLELVAMQGPYASANAACRAAAADADDASCATEVERSWHGAVRRVAILRSGDEHGPLFGAIQTRAGWFIAMLPVASGPHATNTAGGIARLAAPGGPALVAFGGSSGTPVREGEDVISENVSADLTCAPGARGVPACVELVRAVTDADEGSVQLAAIALRVSARWHAGRLVLDIRGRHDLHGTSTLVAGWRDQLRDLLGTHELALP